MKRLISCFLSLVVALPLLSGAGQAQQQDEGVDIRDLIGEAKSALEKGEHEEAYRAVVDALDKNKNHPEANFLLGQMFRDGIYLTPNITRAINRYMNATQEKDEKGNLRFPEAAYVLGQMFMSGEGVPMSPQTAYHWFMMASPNHAESLVQAGEMRLYGYGVTRNMNMALDMLSRAADAGSGRAYDLLETMYKQRYISREQAFFGVHVPQVRDLSDSARAIRGSVAEFVRRMELSGPGQPRLSMASEMYFFEDDNQGKYRIIMPGVILHMGDGGKLSLGTVRIRIEREQAADHEHEVEVIVPGRITRTDRNGSAMWSINLQQRTFDGVWSTKLNNFSVIRFRAEKPNLEVGEIPYNISYSANTMVFESGAAQGEDGTWLMDVKAEFSGFRRVDQQEKACCLYIGGVSLKAQLDKVRFNDYGAIFRKLGFDPQTGFWGIQPDATTSELSATDPPAMLDGGRVYMKLSGLVMRDDEKVPLYDFDTANLEATLSQGGKVDNTGLVSQVQITVDMDGFNINPMDEEKAILDGKLSGKFLIEQLATESARKGLTTILARYAQKLANIGDPEPGEPSRGNMFQVIHRAYGPLVTKLFMAEPGLNIFNLKFDLEKTSFDLEGYLRTKRDAKSNMVISMTLKLINLRALLERLAPAGREVDLPDALQAFLDMGDKFTTEDGREGVGFTISAKKDSDITVNRNDVTEYVNELKGLMFNQTAENPNSQSAN